MRADYANVNHEAGIPAGRPREDPLARLVRGPRGGRDRHRRLRGFALRYDSPALDAISCSVPVARLTPAREERIVAVMREIRIKAEATVPAGSGSVHWR
ncbi:hypothetical protein GCM10017668_21930 [Streptomyces tuirus]|uniref:IclR-ED domain-containing protein n=1 Tax=Streptomyces tuirus TaxID=68278 RepID=A0A7G1NF68_9ACTN|nr:hypothetical protein GCM10017668_21930 [Streptomyces tuirus]